MPCVAVREHRENYTCTLIFAVSLLALCSSVGCDPQQDARLRSLEHDLKQLKPDVAELRQKQTTPEHH